MLSPASLDQLQATFDDDRLVDHAGLLLPATLAQHLGLQELADSCVDLGDAPGRANAGKPLPDRLHASLRIAGRRRRRA